MFDYRNHKTLFVVGGPNGSGKTTLAKELIDSLGVTYISADDIAYEINPSDPHHARIQAGKEFFRRLERVAQNGGDIIVESTLSGKSLLPIMDSLRKHHGYTTVIAFIYLANEHLCAERVSIRVKKGGHFVPFQDIQRRFKRSLVNFWSTYRVKCDAWHLFYNSSEGFQEVARSGDLQDIVLNDELFGTFKEMVESNE